MRSRWWESCASRGRLGVEEQAVTFIGHSSFLVQMKGLGVLIDPVFATRLILLRRQRRAGVRVKDLPTIDAVLLTHAHMDHLNRPSLRAVVKEMRRRGRVAPVAIVPNGVGGPGGGPWVFERAGAAVVGVGGGGGAEGDGYAGAALGGADVQGYAPWIWRVCAGGAGRGDGVSLGRHGVLRRVHRRLGGG